MYTEGSLLGNKNVNPIAHIFVRVTAGKPDVRKLELVYKPSGFSARPSIVAVNDSYNFTSTLVHVSLARPLQLHLHFRCLADHSFPASSEFRKTWIHIHAPSSRLHDILLHYLSTGTSLSVN